MKTYNFYGKYGADIILDAFSCQSKQFEDEKARPNEVRLHKIWSKSKNQDL